jgi:hypothetical protein
MLKYLIVAVLSILLTAVSYSQDPGIQDSVIISAVDVGGDSTVELWVWVKTDDSVGYYNIPLVFRLVWGQPGWSFTNVTYYPPILFWDVLYDTLISYQNLHMFAQYDTGGGANPPLYTHSYRVHAWNLNFEFDPYSIYLLEIDTTSGPSSGSLLFRLSDGVTEFAPAFVKGCFGVFLDTYPEIVNSPDQISLYRNYPNPFNSSTTIEFALPEAAHVELSVYNILGQKVAVLFNGRKAAGNHTITWDAGDMSSGVYFARLEAENHYKNLKMILMK